MKIKQALKLIEDAKYRAYRVHFEWIRDGVLVSDYVPDKSEQPFEEEEEAWSFARELANALKGEACNFYVVDSARFTPVPGYKDKLIANR